MSDAMDTSELVVGQLTAALQGCLETAGETGHNLPEMLSEALVALAVQYRSVEALVAQRPGSWEAEHVRQLAAGAQYKLDQALRNEAAELDHQILYDDDPAVLMPYRCSCGWPANASWPQAEAMQHVRAVVEDSLVAAADEAGHVPVWTDGGPVSCSCGWPNALEEGGATILDHFRLVIAPPAPSPAERAAELARRYGGQGEEVPT
jgi:hypothetical protein